MMVQQLEEVSDKDRQTDILFIILLYYNILDITHILYITYYIIIISLCIMHKTYITAIRALLLLLSLCMLHTATAIFAI